jgi:sugar phosphate isomerase/epimerase
MRLLESEDPDWLKEVKRGCLSRGSLNVSNNFARPEPEMPAQIALGKRGIDLALMLGVPQVRLFAGVPAEGDDRRAAWNRCVAALKECAEYGYQISVQMCLQNHNHRAITEYQGRPKPSAK